MRTAVRLALAPALAGLLAAALPAADAPKPPPGFTALFNGKDLTGWKGHTTMKERATLPKEKLAELQAQRTKAAMEQWSVQDGAIHLTPVPKGKQGVSLVTEKDYGNFELMVDWKIAEKGDSGLYLRGQPQVQIWDSDNSPGARGEDKGSGSGGLWNNPLPKGADPKSVGKMPLKKADKPVGQWNTFRIIMKGDKVTVYLNGTLVLDNQPLMNYFEKGQPLPKKGPIELQHHGDRLWFRNVFIKELPDDEG